MNISVGVLATTITLDFALTAVEEAVGSGGNSTVAELEVRVETLEGTATDHETRISATESDVNGRKPFQFVFFGKYFNSRKSKCSHFKYKKD